MLPADTLQEYEVESHRLILEGFAHISDEMGDRFSKRTDDGEEIVKLHYHNGCGWQRISHRIIKRAD